MPMPPIAEGNPTIKINGMLAARIQHKLVCAADITDGSPNVLYGVASLLWDHHFQLPLKKLDAEKTSIFNAGQNQQIEIYNYPGGYAKKYDESNGDLGNIFTDKKETVKNRIKSLDTQYKTTSGASDCCTLTTGYRFTLQNHPNKDFNKQYMFVAVTHTAEQSPDYLVGDVLPRAYENEFVCLPLGAGQPEYCPPVTTPKPRMFGSQTATVVGPAGEEIYTDKYGRVKVQFHWDRDGKYDPNSSCWMRVIQPWAGKNWGTICIPRIGHEVVVEFLEGDPDQPIVSGSVYNPANMPPYKLPENAHTMGFKSDSTKGSSGHNELAIIDDKGKELFRIHAQKDMDTTVRNNRTTTIIHNDSLTIKEGDRTEIIEKGGDSLEIKLGGRETKIINAADTLTAKTIKYTALEKMELICGASKIILEPGKITIESPEVQVLGKPIRLNC